MEAAMNLTPSPSIFTIMADVRAFAIQYQGGVNCIETFGCMNSLFVTSGWGMRGSDEIVKARNEIGRYALEKYGRKVKIIRNRGHRLWWTNLNDLRCGFEIEMTEDEHTATIAGAWNSQGDVSVAANGEGVVL
jgi:hypothetical protein